MSTWVALLRAVNLGTRNQVRMGDLRALLESLGYDDVRTHLQSGNALFAASGTASGLEKQIAGGISKRFGLDITVMVRSTAQLRNVVAGNPFGGAPAKELQVAFLSTVPPAAKVRAIDPKGYPPDELAFGTRAVYLHLRNGFQGSKLPDLEKALGVRATVRTWNTVTRLGELAAG